MCGADPVIILTMECTVFLVAFLGLFFHELFHAFLKTL